MKLAIRLFYVCFVAYVICSSTTANTQINRYSVGLRDRIPKYDSLKNIPNAHEIKSLIGQTIYFPAEYAINGYKDTFYKNRTFSSTVGNTTPIYEPSYQNSPYTKPEAITGKSFKILDIDEKSSGLLDYCFTLVETNINGTDSIDPMFDTSKKRIYMTYPAYQRFPIRFVTMGYVKKQSESFLNKDFVWSGRNFLTSLTTGREEKIPAGTIFKCVDVGLINGSINAVMESPEYGRYIGDLHQIKGAIFCFHEKKAYNQWVKSYGKTVAKRMLEGDIYVGMTKKMVQASWGLPDEINSITTSGGTREQWVYPNCNRYLYFTGNKLTGIQNM